MGSGKWSQRNLCRFRLVRIGGFAYVLLLIGIAVLSVGAAATLQLGAQMSRRDTEQALLFVGGEFERALRRYAGVPASASATATTTPVAAGVAMARGPRTLEELLKDGRVPGIRRHLRQIYADPMTGNQRWGLVKDPAGFIVGVYSLAEGRPIQQNGFEAHRAHFEEAQSYGSWVFGLPVAQLESSIRSGPQDSVKATTP